jgi:predicted nuclease of predicted toxin-antitoxin system
VKLLLDEDLSRRLVPRVQGPFPGSSQVALLGLERASDGQLCDFAAEHDVVVCSKDADFQRLVMARGYRPRLVQLALGNVCNDALLSALLAAAADLYAAFSDPATGVVVVEAARARP